MEYILVGEMVNTHGIKGEVRLRSDFRAKQELFLPGRKLYVGKRKEEVTIRTYRVHKEYDMLTFEGLNDINEVLPYKGEFFYANRSDLKERIYPEDLIGLDAYVGDRYLGTIIGISQSKAHELLEIEGESHYYVPNIPEFIEKISLESHKIYFIEMTGLFDEN